MQGPNPAGDRAGPRAGPPQEDVRAELVLPGPVGLSHTRQLVQDGRRDPSLKRTSTDRYSARTKCFCGRARVREFEFDTPARVEGRTTWPMRRSAAHSPNLLPGACDAVRRARQWSSVVAQVWQARSATTTPARAACGRGPGRVGQVPAFHPYGHACADKTPRGGAVGDAGPTFDAGASDAAQSLQNSSEADASPGWSHDSTALPSRKCQTCTVLSSRRRPSGRSALARSRTTPWSSLAMRSWISRLNVPPVISMFWARFPNTASLPL